MPFAGTIPSSVLLLLLVDVPWAEGRWPEASWGLTGLMSKNGCGGFAGLVAATAGAGEAYHHQKSGSGGGLTIFCPDDEAVAAFDPTFRSLPADGQLAVLLYHGVSTRYSEKALEAIDGEVETLAGDGGRAGSYNLTARDDGGTVKVSSSTSSSSSRSEARVTNTVVDKARLAVYHIDAVLLPRKLHDGSGAAPSPAPSLADEDGDARYWYLGLGLGIGLAVGLAMPFLSDTLCS